MTLWVSWPPARSKFAWRETARPARAAPYWFWYQNSHAAPKVVPRSQHDRRDAREVQPSVATEDAQREQGDPDKNQREKDDDEPLCTRCSDRGEEHVDPYEE